MERYRSIEICAGAGGQALGLHQAGVEPLVLVEIDKNACNTLRFNQPDWNILEMDVREFSASPFAGQVDLFAGGVPCPPFSIAGKQLGKGDERDLFPEALRLIEECQPKAVLLENVKGFLSKKFTPYREHLVGKLEELGYTGSWHLVNASDHGVSQLRPRAIYVGFKSPYYKYFKLPLKTKVPETVGEVLLDQMKENGWAGADAWKMQANKVAPTLVGGSKKHGGADLGPTRARAAWAKLGVDGRGLANEAPGVDFEGMPRLTVSMAATIQGFPEEWVFTGKKTPAYRQVGNAFPPPVAKVVGQYIVRALEKKEVIWQNGKALELNYEHISKPMLERS